MPFETLRIVPSVDIEKTLSDNAAGISFSNFIRWRDKLPEKRGGSKYFNGNSATFGVVRALHAWQGLSNFKFLAIGSTTALTLYYYNALTSTWTTTPITPKSLTVNLSPTIVSQNATSLSDTTVIVDDAGRAVTLYCVVIFETQASVPNFGSFGARGENFGCFIPSKGYQLNSLLAVGKYTITGTNGHVGAASTGLVPLFKTTSGSPIVRVDLQGQTYQVGDVVDFNVSTTVGGITIFGRYIVSKSVITATSGAYPDPNVGYFEFRAQNNATSTTSGSMNGGNLRLTYWDTNNSITGSTAVAPSDWFLDNWGETLIANPVNGPIFTWTVSAANQLAAMIPNSPPVNAGCFVAMPQQMIMAWGSTYTTFQDPLQIRWSDAGNYNDWTPTTNNQAGGFTIPTGSKIVRGIQGPTQQYWWTDIDLYVSQYVGTPFIFGFNKVGSGCGLIAPKAVGQLGPTLYWMSQKQFYSVSSTGGVQPIPCSVWDYVFQNLNESYTDNIRCAPNSQFNEISWFFPGSIGNVSSVSNNGGGTIKVTLVESKITLVTGMSVTLDGMSVSAYNGSYTITTVVGDPNSFTVTKAFSATSTGIAYSNENDSYVTYNVLYNEWDVGKLARSAWANQSIFGAPLAADTSGYIYQHDVTGVYNLGNDNIPINAYFETGYFSLTSGNDLVFVDWMLPDMKWDTFDGSQTNATLKISFNVTDYPGDTPTTYGPFTITQATEYIEPRFRGRYMQIIVESDDSNSFWRLGSIRYRYAASGRR